MSTRSVDSQAADISCLSMPALVDKELFHGEGETRPHSIDGGLRCPATWIPRTDRGLGWAIIRGCARGTDDELGMAL